MIEQQSYEKQDVDRYRRKVTNIMKNYTNIHVNIPKEEKRNRPIQFVEEMIFITDPLEGMYEVANRDPKDIHPDYMIEKLEQIKGQVEHTLRYFKSLQRK